MLYQHLRPPFWQRHPWVTAAGVLLVYWQFTQGWYLAVALTVAVVATVAIRRHRRASAQRRAGLRARADYEHRLSLAGDPRGLYGRYPPIQPGWFHDPQNRWQLRYFDGAVWTRHTASPVGR
jgi:Protein of unknown function (DUF2510)